MLPRGVQPRSAWPWALALACVLLGYGIHTARHAKLDVFPDFVPPQVTVQAEAPGMTPERAKTMRDAFNAMTRDAEFVGEANKIGLSVNPMTGEEVQKQFAAYYETPKPVVERAMQAMGR